MNEELKQILRDNNISGFQGESINDLVRELKCDNLCLKRENMLLKAQIEELQKR